MKVEKCKMSCYVKKAKWIKVYRVPLCKKGDGEIHTHMHAYIYIFVIYTNILYTHALNFIFLLEE